MSEMLSWVMAAIKTYFDKIDWKLQPPNTIIIKDKKGRITVTLEVHDEKLMRKIINLLELLD